jgi:hypothetical protein
MKPIYTKFVPWLFNDSWKQWHLTKHNTSLPLFSCFTGLRPFCIRMTTYTVNSCQHTENTKYVIQLGYSLSYHITTATINKNTRNVMYQNQALGICISRKLTSWLS